MRDVAKAGYSVARSAVCWVVSMVASMAETRVVRSAPRKVAERVGHLADCSVVN